MGNAANHVPDIQTFLVSLTAVVGAIGASVLGSLAMVKKIKAGWDETFPAKQQEGTITQSKIIGTMLMETTTAAMLTESNRKLAETLNEYGDMLKEHKSAICSLRDEFREHRAELREHRHSVERNTDRMPR